MYIVIGIVLGLIAGLVAMLGGQGIAAWVFEQRNLAFGSIGVAADLVAQPIIWVMTNPLIGGVVAGLAWPLALLEFALLFVMSLVGLGGGAAGAVGNQL
jgi:hypothetical protein